MKAVLVILVTLLALASALKKNEKSDDLPKTKRSFDSSIFPAVSVDSADGLFQSNYVGSQVQIPQFSEVQIPNQHIISQLRQVEYPQIQYSGYSGFSGLSEIPQIQAYSTDKGHIKQNYGSHSYRYITKQVPVAVPVPQPYEVIKKVLVPTPYRITVPKPYAVAQRVQVPVEVPKPYAVQVPHRVPVAVPERVAIEIPRPYPVYKTKEIRVEIEKPVFIKERVEVRVPVPTPYQVEVPSAVHLKVPHKVILKEPRIVETIVKTRTEQSAGYSPVQYVQQAGLDLPSYNYGSSQLAGQAFGQVSNERSFGESIPSISQQTSFGQQTFGSFGQSSLGQSFTGQEGIEKYPDFLKRSQNSPSGTVNLENESVSVGSLESRAAIPDDIVEDKKESDKGKDSEAHVVPEPDHNKSESETSSEQPKTTASTTVKEEPTTESKNNEKVNDASVDIIDLHA